MSEFLKSIQQPVPILIVDDSAEDREIFRLNADLFYLEVLQAESGEQALETLCQRRDIKLVIVDINLGCGMSGIEVIKAISRLPEPQPKTIVMSGHCGDVIEQLNAIRICPAVSKNAANIRKLINDICSWCSIPHRPAAQFSLA